MATTTRYAGKVTVVTGAASGIGLATVRSLIDAGARVVGGDLNEQGLSNVAREFGEQFTPIVMDVAKESDVESLVGAAVSAYGRLDAAFNVAGIGDHCYILDMSEALWDRIMSITLKGVFFSIKHEARAMVTQGSGGAIVNVASISGRRPQIGLTAYGTAKAGVDMLTRSAALEFGEYQIRVNAVAPGIVVTPATSFFTEDGGDARDVYLDTIPLGRFGDPEDVAAAALFLASDDATWVSGANLVIDGAESLTGVPSLMKLRGIRARHGRSADDATPEQV